MAIEIVVPTLGESVKSAVLLRWHMTDGQMVKMDQPVCELETDKANVDVTATAAGSIKRLKKEGEQVGVGEVIARIEPSSADASSSKSGGAEIKPAGENSPPPAATPPIQDSAAATKSEGSSTKIAGPSAAKSAGKLALEDYSPAVRMLLMEHHLDPAQIAATGPNGRLTKEDVAAYLKQVDDDRATRQSSIDALPPALKPLAPRGPTMEKKKDVATVVSSAPPQGALSMDFDAQGIHRAPMSKIRKRIAQTLVAAQQTAAILTTFNEVDVSAIIDLRTKYKERFQEVHGVGLGFMSFFARACVLALREFPRVNAFIDGDDVVYHQFVHLGIAVSTDRGLAVPVLRNVHLMSFARIEAEIKRLAGAVRDGKLSIEELSGGTFTITNGGVFGSLLSTPIINPPQSGILGMHAIQKRPVVINDKIEIRSMMYIALSYDHRLVDGKESVSFLVRLKQYLEDPARLMLEI